MTPQNETKPRYRGYLVYVAEAVIPMELIYGSPRVLTYDEIVQDQHRRDDTVLLEENHLRAATRVARYQQAPSLS